MSLNIFSIWNARSHFVLHWACAHCKSTSASSAQLLLLPKACNCHSCYSLNWAFRFILKTVNNFFIPYLEEDSKYINYLPCKPRDQKRKKKTKPRLWTCVLASLCVQVVACHMGKAILGMCNTCKVKIACGFLLYELGTIYNSGNDPGEVHMVHMVYMCWKFVLSQ